MTGAIFRVQRYCTSPGLSKRGPCRPLASLRVPLQHSKRSMDPRWPRLGRDSVYKLCFRPPQLHLSRPAGGHRAKTGFGCVAQASGNSRSSPECLFRYFLPEGSLTDRCLWKICSKYPHYIIPVAHCSPMLE